MITAEKINKQIDEALIEFGTHDWYNLGCNEVMDMPEIEKALHSMEDIDKVGMILLDVAKHNGQSWELVETVIDAWPDEDGYQQLMGFFPDQFGHGSKDEQHDSYYSTHNEPAYPNGPCDCRLNKADDDKTIELMLRHTVIEDNRGEPLPSRWQPSGLLDRIIKLESLGRAAAED